MRTYLALVRARLAELSEDRKGVTTLEYATIAAVTVLVTAAGMVAISPKLTALWTAIATNLPTPGAG